MTNLVAAHAQSVPWEILLVLVDYCYCQLLVLSIIGIVNYWYCHLLVLVNYWYGQLLILSTQLLVLVSTYGQFGGCPRTKCSLRNLVGISAPSPQFQRGRQDDSLK